jgi:hypothetical protein
MVARRLAGPRAALMSGPQVALCGHPMVTFVLATAAKRWTGRVRRTLEITYARIRGQDRIGATLMGRPSAK